MMVGSRSTLVALLCLAWVYVSVGAELTCPAANNSAIGVSFKSIQNSTGDWQHSIVLSKRGKQNGFALNREDIPWNVEVDYQPAHCDADVKDSLNVRIWFSVRRVRNPEYKFYPGLGYYKYHPTLDTWAVAKEACEKEGAHLAIINSQREADTLKQLIVSTDWAYLGLQKHDARGEFFTLFGEPLSKTGFTSWYSGVNPASAPASYVAVLHRTAGTFAYSAVTEKRVSICEQDL